MSRYTFKKLYKYGNNDIKDIQMLVNRSLGLDMSSTCDELSDFSEISSEISSDFKNGRFPICNSPVPTYETDLENVMLPSCDQMSTDVNEERCSTKSAIKDIEQLCNYESHENKITIQESSRAKHVCFYCSKCFASLSKLKRHSRSHNVSENISDYEKINELPGKVLSVEKRNNCGSREKADSKIKMRKEKCMQKCPFCSKNFKFLSKLARHIKTHGDFKPYVCQFCSKTFLESFNLLAHINTHTDEKAHVCDTCQRSFRFKSNLTRHLQSHMKRKLFMCNECGKECSSEKNLTIHRQKHEEKTHKCTECEKTFKKKSNMKRHLETHSNGRKYSCDLCDYTAKRNSNLKRHVERKHTK